MKRMLGWIAVVVSLAIACVWASWGTPENFHEGWRSPTLAGNLAMSLMFLGPMLITLALASGAICFPRVFGLIHVFVGVGVIAFWVYQRWPITAVFFKDILTLSGVLIIGLGALYYFGRPTPRKWAFLLLILPPLLIVVALSIEPLWRIAHRIDDGIRTARVVEGNGVRLLWAPEGPGWPESGCDWFEAQRRCRYLSDDGSRLEEQPRDLWRLPTTAEVVASMTRAGANAGGKWNPETQQADYRIQPDKESPLWIPKSQIIYYWTADEVDPSHAQAGAAAPGSADAGYARFVAANGYVGKRPKRLGMGSHAFRAVRAASNDVDRGPDAPAGASAVGSDK